MNAQITQKNRTSMMALCGLFAALTAICSWISIPLGFTPVPVNLATLAVFLAGALLGPKYGPLSLTVYAFVGLVGAPVFAGFRGGLSVLAGPTGGYIIGYIVAAFVTGLLISIFTQSDTSASTTSTSAPKSHALMVGLYALAMVAGLAACYILGTLWFMVSTHTGLGAALVSCIIPFLPGDALKIIAGTLLARKLKKFI